MSEPTSPGGDRPSVPPPPPPVAGGAHALHASGLPTDVRTWAMLAHLSAFAGAFVALAFLGPLVVWLVKREEHPFLDDQGREALNFNLSILFYGIVGGIVGVVLTLVTFGLGIIPVLLLAGAAAVGWIALIIVAAVKANNGESYRYPLTIRFVR